MLAALFVSSFALAEDKEKDKDKLPARRIPTTDLKVTTPEKADRPTSPAVIASADELAKSPVVKDAADEIRKQIDFEKEKLVVFAWNGRAKDVVGPTAAKTEGKKTTVVFTFTPGATKDSRQHVFLYAVPKDAEVKVETNSKVPKL
jgi:hypothetical protein